MKTLEEMVERMPSHEKVDVDCLEDFVSISGIGKGSAYCYSTAKIPIAVHCGRHGQAERQLFKAKVAVGCAENIPAILGCDSMQEKDAVILLRQGQEHLVFPGRKGYKIIWSEGTKTIPLTRLRTPDT